MSSDFKITPVGNEFKTLAAPEYNGIAASATAINTGDVQPTDFATALKETGAKMVQSIENAEALSIAGIKGEAGAYEVVSSIMQAEQSLRMAVSVRDKIISAYLEISRMQI